MYEVRYVSRGYVGHLGDMYGFVNEQQNLERNALFDRQPMESMDSMYVSDMLSVGRPGNKTSIDVKLKL